MIKQHRGHILLVDDDPMVRKSTAQWLSISGFDVQECENAEQAITQLNEDFAGILLTDVRMPGMDGLSLMSHALQQIPQLPVILLTAHGDIDMAMDAMRQGAYDFQEKPFIPERLVEVVHRACEKRQLMLENRRLQTEVTQRSGLDQRLIGISPAIQLLRQEIMKLAELDTNVIVYGETGTGKELVTQCLHDFSKRRDHNFVAINCGALPENLIESELFGHEAGAFTGAGKKRVGKFEYADGGTLLLDEIESMPTQLQIKLLRTLQEGVIERLGANKTINVNLRVIAATKSDLLHDDNFRQDLFYRLNVSQLYIPPLRQRLEDVPLLFSYYANQAAQQQGFDFVDLNEQAIRSLQHYQWPGNVRELKNIAVRYALDPQCNLHELLFQPQTAQLDEQPQEQQQLPLALQVAEFEAKVISTCLAQHQGNIKEVMAHLDLPRRTLNQKMQKYGLNRSDYIKGDSTE